GWGARVQPVPRGASRSADRILRGHPQQHDEPGPLRDRGRAELCGRRRGGAANRTSGDGSVDGPRWMGCHDESVSPRERVDGWPPPTRAGPSARGLDDASRRRSHRRGGGEAREAGRPGMAGGTFRASVCVPRGDRPGSSAVLGEWHLEFARRPDRHAQGISDCRAGSGVAPNRVRGVLRLDCDPRRPSPSVSTLISRGPDGPAMRVVLGGTFDILHKGHEALLRTAFEGRPERVLIGLTTDRFARESRSGVNPYAARERNLKRFLTARKWGPAKIEPIDDPYRPADALAERAV